MKNLLASLTRSCSAWQHCLERIRQARLHSPQEAINYGWHAVMITVLPARIACNPLLPYQLSIMWLINIIFPSVRVMSKSYRLLILLAVIIIVTGKVRIVVVIEGNATAVLDTPQVERAQPRE